MISLEAATRTCNVDTASAARLESDRFLNPVNVVCPNWTGKDLAGRQVAADSFYTKRAGCNSAADRVIVEYMLRPQYSEYINLDVGEGLRGQLYANNMYYTDAGVHTKQMRAAGQEAGHFGGVFSSGTTAATCSNYGAGPNDVVTAYEFGTAQMERQVAQNNSRAGPRKSCHRGVRHGGHHHGHHTVEGYQQAPPSFTRANAALNSGYRSCQFSQASGF